MALKHVVGIVIISFIILHGECAPRSRREDDSDNGTGSGDGDMLEDGADEYDDAGAGDFDDSSEDTSGRLPSRPTVSSDPMDDGNNDVYDNEIDHHKPTTTANTADDDAYDEEDFEDVIEEKKEDHEDEDPEDTNNGADLPGEDFVPPGNEFIAMNSNVDTGRMEEPLFDKDHEIEDQDSAIGKDEGPSVTTNLRDNFFGKSDSVIPDRTTDTNTGHKYKDPKIEDQDLNTAVSIPSVTTNERDNFFGKSNSVTPDKTSDAVSDHKYKDPKIEDQDLNQAVSKDKRPSITTNERDNFFGKSDSVIPENTDADTAMVGISIKKTDVMIVFDEDLDYDDSHTTEDPIVANLKKASQMSIAEEKKMKQLIGSAIELFRGSPCHKGARNQLNEKCIVLGEIINTLGLVGVTFDPEIENYKTSHSHTRPAKPTKKWRSDPHVIFGK